jgi:ATP-dependent RNA helicase RhlE
VPETYVHRIGRSGRAGVKGTAITLCDETERPYIADIQKLIKMEIPLVENHPFLTVRAANREAISLRGPVVVVNKVKGHQPKQDNQGQKKKKTYGRPWNKNKKSEK